MPRSQPPESLPRGSVPHPRVLVRNGAPVRSEGDYVLYWMISSRRTRSNFALDRAIEWAEHLGRPLLVLEGLRVDYPWASDRLHQFVVDGMLDNAARLARAGVRHLPWVEPQPGAGRGLLEALSTRACLVVTDDYPCFFLPRMVDAAATRLAVRLESVDSNGLIPLRAPERELPRAASFRTWLGRHLARHAVERPRADPLASLQLPALDRLPPTLERWARQGLSLSQGTAELSAQLASLPIDHRVLPTGTRGGASAARARLGEFVRDGLDRYLDDRNDPDSEATSRLSPWLHFGHLSSHEIVDAVARHEGWSPDQLPAEGTKGSMWGMRPPAEAFLDQLVTWRELGFNLCVRRADYAEWSSIPAWARATLEAHASDRRPVIYSMEQLEAADTGDELWNAAQRELVRDGRIHNYLRMVWGKRLLEWTKSPEDALRVMIILNDKYALDGRDPSSYNGIGWVLGRYDHAWGPERPIFGTVRYMSSKNTARKVALSRYLARYAR